ncbi:MAG: PHP domain-containing protein [Oscillospiraceae bacterium]|jgi:histidinol-phosphatase (PHP family)|nr:PHP domain-containing protein [Oscillospiraceae bacterium]
MYLCDIHSHTKISPDSQAQLRDTAQAAIDAGLREFCVTDHFDLLGLDGKPLTAFDWPAAKEQYRGVKEELGDRLVLRLGLELGSATYDPAIARDVLAQGGEELDFVLGSMHNWIGEEENLDFYFSSYQDNPELARRALEGALEHTWTLVAQLPDCYDSLAHIVYPLRYIHRDGIELSLADYEDQVRAIFTQVAKTDHAMEVNVCRGHDLDCWPPILRWFKECGGKLVTVGADAHRPDQVARGIPEALQMLQAAGFDCVTTFAGRKPVLHKL